MAGALSGFVSSLLGVNSPSTQPLDQDAQEAQRRQGLYGGREAQNYGQEQQLGQHLQGVINGSVPSVAATQLRQGQDVNNADALAAGAGASGVNSVLARYQARQAQGEQAARLQQSSALLRAQEIAQATGQLQQLQGNMGQQSGNLYGANQDEFLRLLMAKYAQDQQNAQRDTILGAAGLGGASSAVSGLAGMGADYFRNSGSSGGNGYSNGVGSVQPNGLMSPAF